MAATTRVESDINLWKTYWPKNHYFNNAPNFSKYMSKIWFQKIRKFFSKCFCEPNMKEKDPWWHILGGVNQYNEIRKHTFTHVSIIVLDENMSTWRSRTTKTGGLPHLMYQQCKLEPLGIKFKTTTCGITGCLLNLEIIHRKNEIKKQTFNASTY